MHGYFFFNNKPYKYYLFILKTALIPLKTFFGQVSKAVTSNSLLPYGFD